MQIITRGVIAVFVFCLFVPSSPCPDLLEDQASCPAYCICDSWQKLWRASCVHKELRRIGIDVFGNFEALDLYNNSIVALRERDLPGAGLTELKYLNLSLNCIKSIDGNAFFQLEKLAILDLSRNSLLDVAPNTFSNNIELEVLKLDFNIFHVKVPKLGSPSIVELGLQGCKISHLPVDTFKELTALQRLDISNNLMVEIHSFAVIDIPHLERIDLRGNNWSCNGGVMKQLLSCLRDKRVLLFDAGVCEITEVPAVLAVEESAQVMKNATAIIIIKSNETYSNSSKITAEAEEWDGEKSSIVVNLTTTTTTTTTTTMEESKLEEKAKMKDLSPYWLLTIGFLMGSAVTIVVTCVLLSGTFLLCPRPSNGSCLYHETLPDVAYHRVRRSLSNRSRTRELDDEDQRLPCPGTPPPPYRDVMSRGNLYPTNPANRLRLISNNGNEFLQT